MAYFRFLFNSTNQYGIHSPFVYDYLTKGLKGRVRLLEQEMRSYRKGVSKLKGHLEVTDFGAGSRLGKKNSRSVSEIAKNAGITSKKGKVLYQTLRYFNPTQILELGTSLGISTAYMSHTCPDATIMTLEGCPETARIARDQFKKHGLLNIEQRIGEFSKTLPAALSGPKYDLIYFDGNHQKEPTLEYFAKCLPHRSENAIFIFDDIHWSHEMEGAWQAIKEHQEVTLSIDAFFWGMIFFKEDRVKQHFRIRM